MTMVWQFCDSRAVSREVFISKAFRPPRG